MDALTTPSNWQRVRLGDIGITISGLAGKTKQDFINGNAKYITFLNVLNNVIIDTSILENVKIYPNEKQNSFKKYDLFFNTSSETPKEVGMCAVLLDDIDQVFLNSFCFGFRIFDKAVDGLFLSYLINSEIGRKAFENLAQGSTRYNLSKSGFNNVCLFLPPLNEQIAIANILSDLDRYLYSLDALILKKESIKKALSFELLSQRKRLKGFNQAWQRVRLGDVAEIIGGGTPSTQITSFWNGSINWFTPTEIGITKYVYKSQRTITPLGLKKSSAKLLPIGTILLTSRASIGDCAILKVVATTNQGFQSLIPLEKINNKFLYYLILTLKNKLLELASGSTFLEVSPNKIKNLLIPLPPLNEQIAIANILSDLDNEIISLKNKKRQFENIKKALNHDLMSAKIRVLNK
ncbi:restriction endonuclease subunit S [Helicobacter pylori]|uniref:restriction endonuclease subunit S n=1 Tax=Helicobacter pylori TaxID=210 RepID=UPI000FDE9000|nr:restriction endonuclease subunit S [Helicobacter pylori]RVY18174.1 restriction endonuclease subunit S [Helicobacter pylori]